VATKVKRENARDVEEKATHQLWKDIPQRRQVIEKNRVIKSVDAKVKSMQVVVWH
jgi:predicted ATP-grasp superfamily ATP-dependent carboligase